MPFTIRSIEVHHSRKLADLNRSGQPPRWVKMLSARRRKTFVVGQACHHTIQCCTIAGIEVMHAIRKGQLLTPKNGSRTPAEQFYALAA
jgi:hypothetical protein